MVKEDNDDEFHSESYVLDKEIGEEIGQEQSDFKAL